jgi:transcriptional regulator with XRE-family HTH domain
MSTARAHTGRRDNLDLKGLGRRLRGLRGFDSTQEEMANELRISQSQLSKYERGVSAPPADVLFFMKNRFDVSIDWLLIGEGSSRTSNKK